MANSNVNAKFWGEKGSRPSSGLFKKKKANVQDLGGEEEIMVDKVKSKGVAGKRGALLKGLGFTGIFVAIIVAIVGIVGYIFVAKPALALVKTANVLKKDSAEIGEAIKNRDLVALNEVLDKTDEDLERVRKERETSFGWAKNISLFKLNEFYSDSDRFINAGVYTVDALREVADVVTPFADAAGLKVSPGQEVIESDGLMEAFQSWVSIMPDVADQMDGVIEKVSKIGKELEPVDTSKYPEEFRGIPIRSNVEFAKNTLSDVSEYAPDIKQALMLIPRVLAVGTPTKRYMIIMQNDKEIRPTGGFMTNYATFKMTNGLLDSDFTSKDMYSIDLTLDAIDATYDFPDGPGPYMKYLKQERWYVRDMNYSPDFPTSMDQFMKFYNMAGRINPYEIKPVDGIFAMDTQVVSELLDVTGPVTVNGLTYTSDNVVLELEKIASLTLAEQAGRKRVLGDLMEAMLINVFESDKNLWPKLIDKAVDLAMRKHVQAYIFDPDAQALLDKYGLAGRIKDPVDGDYSLIVSTNLGADKTNWFTHKEVTHELTKDGNDWVRTVKIKYTYNQPSAEFAPFVKRFRDWVRVYAPEGSELIGIEGSTDEMFTDTERGKVWWSGYLELGPGESKELVFKYKLPFGVVSNNVYKLTIQKQAGIDEEVHYVKVGSTEEKILLKTDTEYVKKL